MSHFPWMPPDASAHGGPIDTLMLLVHVLMAILFVGWGAFFVYCLVRFRRGRNPEASYTGTKGKFSKYTEAGVVVAEVALLVAAVIIWIPVKARVPTQKEADVTVRVVAEQFAWNIHYPGPDGVFGRTDVSLVASDNPLGLDRSDPHAADDITTVNQLHLPVNRLALIQLSSKDVIHSFFLPAMRVKQDAIPGMVTPVWFKPIKAGDYQIACAQLCGLGHYRMKGYLTIHEEGGYEAWLKEQASQL